MWNSIIQNILLLTLNQIVMKHSLLAANLFIIAAVMTSCQKEQSELTLESLPDKAVITGTVKYEVGDYQAETDGAIISNYQLPISGQTVMVTIPTANYADNTDGNQYFEAVTDDDGNYRIEIPISTKALTASIKVVPFYATKTLMRNNAIVEIPNALYNTTKAVGNTTSTSNITLNQRDIKVVNLVATSASELPVAFDQEVEVNGEVTVEAWIKNEDAGSKDSDAYIGVPGSHNSTYYPGEGLADYPVTVTAKIVNNKDNKTLYEIYVTATTNRDGKYTAKMTLPTNCYDNGITTTFSAKVDASLGTFEHWYAIEDARNVGEYNWENIDVDVVYNESTSGSTTLTSKHELGIAVKIPTFNVTTAPADEEAEIPGVNVLEDGNDYIKKGDPFDWDNDLN